MVVKRLPRCAATALLMLACLLPRGARAVTPYVYGILPAAAADADLSSAYGTWKSRRFKTITCGSAMAWVDNGSGNAFSEGVAYGMLMTAYLDATSIDFAKLERFYEMKRDSHTLMNWNVPGNCGTDNGANAATDADLDAAIALIRAHRKWPAEGWGAKATTVLNAIYANMVDGCSGIKNGDTWGGCSSGASNAYNPSYFRTAYFPSFNCFEGGSRWTAVRNRSYSILNTAYSSYALPPDWVRNDGSYGQATNSGGYGYDSCRTPWSLTQDYLWWGNGSGQNWARKIAQNFGNKSGGWGNPASAASDVGDDYSYYNGNKVRGNHENAFIGGAAVAFMGTTYSAQLNAFYNELKFNDNNSYYSDSLKVIYLMILTGAFQEPCYGPGPIPTATPTSTPTLYAGTPTQTPQPAFGIPFEDFENGLSGGYAYTGPTQARSATAAYNGSYGYQVGGTLAGGGVGFNSSYANGQGVVDATGAVSLRFWVKSNVNISFVVDWFEGGDLTTPVAGGDGEAWVSGAQNVTGDAAWHQIVIPIAGMTEEVYNGVCNPAYGNNTLCATSGNNTKNLSSISKIQLKFTLGSAASVQFDDFEFVLGTQPTPTVTRTPFIGSYNQVFDDIESPLSLNQSLTPARAGAYADTANGATATVGTTTGVLPPGGGGNTTAGVLSYNTGTGSSYGAGGYLLSPYGTPGLYVDVSGAVFLGLWINATAGTVFRLEYTEAGTPTSPTAGADGEAWQSGPITASGGWEFLQFETGSFSEDLYNPTCNPSSATPGPCGTTGNGIKDYQAISSVTLKLDGNQGAGNFYFDDVVFVTSFKTPTPSHSPSNTVSPTRSPTNAGTPTATITPTLSYSSTPSASATGTASISPTGSPSATLSGTRTASATATPTATPSGTRTASPTASPSATASPTPSDSPTETPYAGSPTSTFTDSPSFTASVTPSATPTATLTDTPAPGSPTATPSASPSGTPSATRSGTPTLTATVTLTATPTDTPQPGTPTFTMVPPTPSVTPTATPSGTPVVPTLTATPSLTVAVGSPTATPSASPTRTASPTPVTAMIMDFAFTWTPAQLTVTAGTNVTWAWAGTHDVQSDTGLFTSGTPVAGGSFNYTFNTPGTYRYYCDLHGNVGGVGMSGIIYVTGAAPSPTPTAAPTAKAGPPIIDTRSYPNPVVGGQGGAIRVELAGPVDGLTLKVYTHAMILVGELSVTPPPKAGWVEISLPASVVGQPAGLYYYVVKAHRNGGTASAPKSGRLVLLR